MSATFNAQWAEQGAWQREFSFLLRLFSRWLKDNALLDAAVQDRIRRLEDRLRSNRVTVAFVPEFSRGKSETVNAIFFANYGRTTIAASAGRIAMCPTEFGFEQDLPPSLRLLPIQTRLQPQALHAWRQTPQDWTAFELDLSSAEQLASTFGRITETLQVTPEEAQAMGFWDTQTPELNPPTDDQGMVQVPKWRHALVNFAHPLLKQGLVILDTPGLNATAAEPELIVGLIDQAGAVVFIVGADTGVTESDLAIWQQLIGPGTSPEHTKLIVLNKIDMLWDELSSAPQIQAQTELQKHRAAMHAEMAQDIAALHAEVGRMVDMRQHSLAEQRAEFEGLQGKSGAVLQQMRQRIAHEQHGFECGRRNVRLVNAALTRHFQAIRDALAPLRLAQEMQVLAQALSRPGLKFGVKKTYRETFSKFRQRLLQAHAAAQEIRELQVATFHQINVALGTALNPLAPPVLDAFLMDLELAEHSHLSYLGVRNCLRLQQPEFTQRLVSALSSRLGALQEAIQKDAEQWCNAVEERLDGQIRMRQAYFATRLDAIETIGNATEGLNERLRDLAVRQHAMAALASKLDEQAAHLVAANNDQLAKSRT